MKWLVVVGALGGCYLEAGLGGARSGATAHGSIGVIAHLGERASLRAGASGAIGPYRPPSGEGGTLTVTPAELGGEVRIAGTTHDSLAAAFAVGLPITGHLHVPNFEASEPATTTRVFAGLGYHHDWWQQPRKPDPDAAPGPRIAGAITTGLGAELWYGASDAARRASSTQLGAGVTIMLEVRAWALGEFFECLSAKKDDCD